MIDLGFILLYRKFFNGKYWRQRRVFSKAEAFLSLLEKAQFKEHEVELPWAGGIYIVYAPCAPARSVIGPVSVPEGNVVGPAASAVGCRN